jgi:hypothetical protein
MHPMLFVIFAVVMLTIASVFEASRRHLACVQLEGELRWNGRTEGSVR